MKAHNQLPSLVVLAIIFLTNYGCSLNELVDKAYMRQFPDRRETGGLTREERRARLEEANIRKVLPERAYSEPGRVPGAP
jgi:hypothetical protein